MSFINKLNITQQGQGELYQIIQNDPFLLGQWGRAICIEKFLDIKEILDDWFIYSDVQIEHLTILFDDIIESNQEYD